MILLLSSKAGLRGNCPAQWTMLIDAEGEVSLAIHLQDNASKGRSASQCTASCEPHYWNCIERSNLGRTISSLPPNDRNERHHRLS